MHGANGHRTIFSGRAPAPGVRQTNVSLTTLTAHVPA
tara:strand:+ start:849 stop:959 length:111 start_codon:yes stop_codon:yes gene_type:complete